MLEPFPCGELLTHLQLVRPGVGLLEFENKRGLTWDRLVPCADRECRMERWGMGGFGLI